MDISHFNRMRAALPGYWKPDQPPVVGYLRGSDSPAVWETMALSNRKPQLIILGNTPPTDLDWMHAGVAERTGETRAITLPQLRDFMIVYDSFPERPWGAIVPSSEDSLTIGFESSLKKWREKTGAPESGNEQG